MKDYKSPFLIEFPKIGKQELGFISIAEKENLPFVPKRIYWTYFTPEDVERGGAFALRIATNISCSCGKGRSYDRTSERREANLYFREAEYRTFHSEDVLENVEIYAQCRTDVYCKY